MLIWFAWTLPAFSQTSLSVKEAVATALKEHPLLQAGTDRISAAEGLRRQAGLAPNPRLVLQSENTRFGGSPTFLYWRDTDNFVYLQQALETYGKRERRVDLANANVLRVQYERELTARQITSRVQQSYWFALGAKRAEELLAESLTNFRRIIEYHEIRVKEGAMAEADLIRVRLEGERLAISQNAAALEAERARIQLFREMGRTEFPPVVFSEVLEPVPGAPSATNLLEALERRPEMKVARQLVDVARSNLRVQQAAAKPNLEVLFGYKRTAGFDTMLGGLQMDLPLANRNQGNIAAASADIRVLEASLAATEALIRAEINAAQRDIEIRRRQIGEPLRVMRSQADETARIAEAAYREGGSDLLRLLDAQRLRIDMQLLYFRALAEYRQSLVTLEAALGITP